MKSIGFSFAWVDYWLEKYRLPLLRTVVVIGVMVASAVIAPRAPKEFLLLIAGVGATLVFLQRPHWGLIALIPASLIVPFEIGTGSQTNLNASVLLLALLLGLWLLTMLARDRKIWLVSSTPTKPLLVFLLVCLLAFLAGQLPWFPIPGAPIRAQIGGLAIFILSFGAFLLVAQQVREVRWLEWMTWLFVGLGALYVLGRLIPGGARYENKIFQYGSAGSMFWTWLVALTVSQAVINRRLPVGWRLVIGGIAVATLYVAIVQSGSWKSGWIPPLIAIFTLVILLWPRLSITMGVVAIFPAVSVVSRLIATDQYSFSTRVDAWRILLQVIKVNPILGLGPANYYWYTPLFPIRGYAVQFNSHNQYVDILAQTGILGLLSFLWLAVALAVVGLRLRSSAPEGFPKAYVYGAIAGLAGSMVAAALGDWVLPFVYNIGFTGFRASVLAWIFLGGLVALEQIIGPRHKPKPYPMVRRSDVARFRPDILE